jgi:hypothetical protein
MQSTAILDREDVDEATADGSVTLPVEANTRPRIIHYA